MKYVDTPRAEKIVPKQFNDVISHHFNGKCKTSVEQNDSVAPSTRPPWNRRMAAMNNVTNDVRNEAEEYMRLALKVARAALAVGEVPVGCVIVLELEREERKSVVVSHGANQVNATRDATRHAEIVAIDRMLTGGMASDQLRLPPETIAKAAHGVVPAPLFRVQDQWVNVPDDPSHWKNEYGWSSGKIYQPDIFANCDLYVTCEPCIMVSWKHYFGSS